MIQIRQSVFETNSSSTHAISICEFHSNIELPKVVLFKTNQDFGWEFEDYTDVYSKANYLWLAICYKYNTLGQEDELIRAKATISQYLKSIGVRAEFEDRRYIESKWFDDKYIDMIGYIDHPGDLYELVDAVLHIAIGIRQFKLFIFVQSKFDLIIQRIKIRVHKFKQRLT